MLSALIIAGAIGGIVLGLNMMGVPVWRYLRALGAPFERMGVTWSPGLILAIAALAIASILLGMLFAVIGLGVFRIDMQYSNIPVYFWQLRGNGEAMEWLGMGTLMAAVFLGALAFLFKFRPTKLHGDARWANRQDINKAGLFEESGILLGRVLGKPLRLGGTEHVIVEAPTRAGKGVGIVIPNLLDWQASAVVLDVKQENFEITAGHRSVNLHQKVFLLDPLNEQGETARYNPLSYIDRTDPIEVISELQKVGIMLFPEPKGEAFWNDSARNGFIGIGAYVAACPDKPFTIGQIYREAVEAKSNADVVKLISIMDSAGRPLSSQARTALMSYGADSENTFSGFRQTVLSKLNLWVNPHVDEATSSSDFEVEDLRLGVKEADGTRVPISLYLGVSPNDIETIQPLYNLLVQQIVDRNVRELYDEKRMFKVLLVLDEFARLGEAKILSQAFSYVAGYGLRLLPVIQSRSQLRAIYGPDVAKEIMTNCGAEVVFGVKEDDICAELERRIGYYTFKAQSRSRKTSDLISSSRSQSDQRRALMMAQEIREMPTSKALVFRANTPAIQAKKVRYYEDPRYKKLLLDPPEMFGGSEENAPPDAPAPATKPDGPRKGMGGGAGAEVSKESETPSAGANGANAPGGIDN